MGEGEKDIASSPFDDSEADIILRSSNNVNFHVYSVVLKLASPIFRDMFSIPQPATQTETPVVEMEEDSTTLDIMLRLCYPGPDPRVTTLARLTSILRVAEKYDLDGVVEKMGCSYAELVDFEEVPIEAFAMACRYRWKEVALTAAKASLGFTTDELLHQEAEALKSVTGMEYHRLFQYHHACRVACNNVTKHIEWVGYYTSTGRFEVYSFERHASNTVPKPKRCSDVMQLGYRAFPSWWCNYMQEIGKEFMLQGPTSVCLIDSSILKTISASECKSCKDVANFGDIYRFLEQFRDRIDSTIKSVKLELSF
ncbi:hypothetical protein PTI98_004044 [Pleurotus ostreatus]|nr:hypothetical protein PTI98_004044 [Pleurotus ostreatus]